VLRTAFHPLSPGFDLGVITHGGVFQEHAANIFLCLVDDFFMYYFLAPAGEDFTWFVESQLSVHVRRVRGVAGNQFAVGKHIFLLE
jgi:hypothetical protein